MDENRLPTHLWLAGVSRRVTLNGDFYYVLRRGDHDSGLVLIKHRTPGGVAVYLQERNMAGDLVFVPYRNAGTETIYVEETDADAYIARASVRDPDLWVVEIETHLAEPFFVHEC